MNRDIFNLWKICAKRERKSVCIVFRQAIQHLGLDFSQSAARYGGLRSGFCVVNQNGFVVAIASGAYDTPYVVCWACF